MDIKLHDLLHKLSSKAHGMENDWEGFKKTLTDLIIRVEELEKERDTTTKGDKDGYTNTENNGGDRFNETTSASEGET